VDVDTHLHIHSSQFQMNGRGRTGASPTTAVRDRRGSVPPLPSCNTNGPRSSPRSALSAWPSRFGVSTGGRMVIQSAPWQSQLGVPTRAAKRARSGCTSCGFEWMFSDGASSDGAAGLQHDNSASGCPAT
jgi:hypothetical protein